MKLSLIPTVIRSTWPRPRPPTPLEEAAAIAARALTYRVTYGKLWTGEA